MPVDLPNAALRRVLLAGATRIVLEGDVERALLTARSVLAGQLTVPSILGQQIAPRPLSHREKQILALVMLGMTNREIAGKLFLAESTVKTHLSSAFRKIDARSRAEAVARIQDPEAGLGAGILAIADGLAADHGLLRHRGRRRRHPRPGRRARELSRAQPGARASACSSASPSSRRTRPGTTPA